MSSWKSTGVRLCWSWLKLILVPRMKGWLACLHACVSRRFC